MDFINEKDIRKPLYMSGHEQSNSVDAWNYKSSIPGALFILSTAEGGIFNCRATIACMWVLKRS